MQHRSLNFRFKTGALDAGHPRGEKFAAGLLKLFSARYGVTQTLEIWRDCGWECAFRADDEEYLLVVSVLEDDSTLVQISPRRLPNALTRLFGQIASASDEGLERRRAELESMLRDTRGVGTIAFTYDGLPSLEGQLDSKCSRASGSFGADPGHAFALEARIGTANSDAGSEDARAGY